MHYYNLKIICGHGVEPDGKNEHVDSLAVIVNLFVLKTIEVRIESELLLFSIVYVCLTV